MGPVESVKQAFQQCWRLRGRASRAEHWWFVLFCAVVSVLLLPLGAAGIWLDEAGEDGARPELQLVGTALLVVWAVLVLLLLPPAQTLKVRRLHDLGMSGWWFWAFMLPMADLAWLVVSLFPSQPEGDRFGPRRTPAVSVQPTRPALHATGAPAAPPAL